MRKPSIARLLRALPLALLLCVQTSARAMPEPAGGMPAGDVTGADLILEVRPEKNRVYLHEVIPVTVTLLAGSVSVRNIQFPRLAGAAFRVTEFASPRKDSVVRDGREYAVYEFSATLVTRRSGDIELGPAELRCDVLAPARGAAAFFGGSEPRAVTLRSQPVHFSILPLPTRGRPSEFSGAVGHFSLTRQATPTAIRSGDPVTVTTRIAGVGNIDSFSCQLILISGVRGYPPRARRTQKRLTCEQVLLPESAAAVEIPALEISFFDPLRERYRILRSKAIRVDVSAAPASADRVRAGLPINTTAKRAGESSSLLVLAAGALLLGALAFLALRFKAGGNKAHVAAVATDPSCADWLAEAERALAANDAANFHTAVFRALQADLAARHGLHAPAITGDIVGKVLRPAGMEEPRMQTYIELFSLCDRARYAPVSGCEGRMHETLRRLSELNGKD